ncbi:GntR family transcriptional regulator [Komagataeibacter oboediens]|uniref:GntR family transcriptional regulator n=1 Tax=Komagataeibacter oboediens TaxID=65958 RepID=A0ABS5SQL0_9PROT|nr:GntR family transcriptional regulator [Komagataeibacter oboediens]MBL7232187.1 GntR family transcriptional regulator [Komagataeibacter oboediens]MBT0675770.1 GntR family transcriptional regulator [Komagataeibacter oboediens]MBT0677820.1 GntR family transcriptional regulator [Komagataeibacter oboediens]MBV1824570.1 GntR family transcriptional regulator [Komagataeibacter oboediens]WEQ51132.1 GntR family transcriptional regulator [Komagataeibacter oboediens]
MGSSAREEARIADALRKAVLERKLAPGSKLPEEELAQIFRSNRAKIRRVLLSLSRSHIVTLEPGRGAFVSRPSPQEARDVLASRRLIEVSLLARPYRKLSTQGVTRLRRIMAQEAEAHEKHDAIAMIHVSGQFHLTLIEELGNEVLKSITEELILRMSLIITMYERHNATCCLSSDHHDLLDLLLAEKYAEASLLMARHLEGIESCLDFHRDPVTATILSQILQPVQG